ncbi:MAG TPA: acyl-[acyl-carrier-protein] thioesterase [Leptospiraceae bacterium]|nr:acyl-[acyl-carrier-protein] thioesterase [Leptospiraceae bacterium]HMW04250.1 acyl-[acyl-carrier-protein] thioesterase [Leptospiraceae bacterium]HMX30596.1 acyl-[acyl-carrier-protein] thioesterase [Leptospiraceae bacterium]HMY31296.1 acyl-[acyl-carrier-protein] thioesterase [Leptospiraceae bacterium]HMZ63409.1 acyl-[acyl-carrier-protein] thioesterase [Leptospiraceae bacterium]
MKNEITLRTNIFDLDWNRHVTSRTYERFSQEGRSQILDSLGFPIRKCMEEGILLIPEFTQVRFLSQQFSDANLRIETQLVAYRENQLEWNHKIYGEDNSLACELRLISRLEKASGETFVLTSSSDRFEIPTIHAFKGTCKQLIHDYTFLYSDLNCFWRYSPDVVWKAFEEGRWLFFSKVADTSKIAKIDTTSFFMGGKLRFIRMPNGGEKVKIVTWIESVEKIRFYLRQDIISETGEIIASMRDEQLFVSLSTSRPKKAPLEFVENIKDFIENF